MRWNGQILVFTSSGLLMVFELMLGRLAARWIGVSCYTWVGMTAVVLAGCTTGNFLADVLTRRFQPQRILSAVFLLNALCIACTPCVNAITGVVFSRWMLPPTWGALAYLLPLACIPAMLFGIVTPCVLAAKVRDESQGHGLGGIYFAGMAGCTVGSLAGGLWLPGWFAVPTIFYLAGLVFLICAGVVLFAGRSAKADGAAPAHTINEPLTRDDFLQRAIPVLATAFVAMGAEMAAAKQVAPLLGASHYVWGVLFAVFILGMGLGGWSAGIMADRWKKEGVLAWGLVAAVFSIYPYGVVMNSFLGLKAAWVIRLPASIQIPVHLATAFLPMAFATGFSATAAVKCALTRRDGGFERGRAGFYWALAGIGNVAGTLCAGFFLQGVVRSSVMLVVFATMLALLACRYASLLTRDQNIRAGSSVLVLVFAGLSCYGLWFGNARELPQWLQPPNTLLLDGEVLYDRESRYNRVLVYQDAKVPRVLTLGLDRTPHSTVDKYDAQRIYSGYVQMLTGTVDAFFPKGEPIRALVVGGGGYVLPRWLSATHPGSSIEVSEIDPAVTDAAYSFFGLAGVDNLVVYNRDGRYVIDGLLHDGKSHCYDLVVGDTIADTAVPYHLVTAEVNAKIKQLLCSDGVYLLHLLDRPDRGRLIGSVVKTLRGSFDSVAVLRWANVMDERVSHIVIATDRDLDAGLVVSTMRRLYPDFEGGVLSDNEIDMLSSRPGTTLLSDDFVPVERLILQDVLDNDKFLRHLDTQWGVGVVGQNPQRVFDHMLALAGRKSTMSYMELELLRRSAAKLNRLHEIRTVFAEKAGIPSGVSDGKVVYGSVLVELKQWDGAARVYAALASLYPDSEAFWMQAIQNALRAGQPAYAKEIFEKSLEHHPQNQRLRNMIKTENETAGDGPGNNAKE